MQLSHYQRLAYRVFGASVASTAQQNSGLRHALLKAHIFVRPEVYLASSYMNMVLAFLASSVFIGFAVMVYLSGAVDLPLVAVALLLPIPVVAATVIYFVAFLAPDLKASMRARDIDAKLPYALNFIATMASAGVTPQRIFARLAEQRAYGELANEAAMISRDIEGLGKDIVNALVAAIDRSPSMKFQDFLQGAITAITSGEDLKMYFLSKAQQYTQENRLEQGKFLETLAVLAESFVTVVVAAPLLLLILLSVMVMFGGGAGSMTFGYLLVLVMLPLAQFGFVMAITFVTPEA